MELIEIALVILLTSWVLKLLLFVAKGGRISLNSFLWNCIWIGKFPSTHTAVLSGVVYTLWYTEGLSPLFGLSVVVSVICVYALLENRRRYELMQTYYIQSHDEAIKSIIVEGKLDEFEGHTVLEIMAGAILGIVVAVFVNMYV